MVSPPQPVTRPDDWVLVLSAHEMVRRLARRTVRRWSPDLDDHEEDLEHVGLLVLHQLAPQFDPERCPRFDAFAWPWVSKAMSRFARRRVKQFGGVEVLGEDGGLEQRHEGDEIPGWVASYWRRFDPESPDATRTALDEAIDLHGLPLNDEERTLVELRLQGFFEREIAERTGLSYKAVRIRLRRVRDRLREAT